MINSIEFESQSKSLQNRKQALEKHIEVLWDKATFGTSASSMKANKSTSSSNWQTCVGKLFSQIIKLNISEDKAIRNATLLLQKQLRQQIANDDALFNNAWDDSIVLPENEEQFFLTTVLAKVVVRNIISEGIRRVALQEYLRRREHQLLLLYGSEEYKQTERDRIQREKDVIEQKRLYFLRVNAAKVMSGGLINYTITQAKTNAEILLFDPWTLLDLDPSTWITRNILIKVDILFISIKSKYEYKWKKLLFHYLSLDYRTKILVNKRNSKLLSIAFSNIRNYTMLSRNITCGAKRIQHMVRAYLFRKSFNSYISQTHVLTRIADSHQCLVLRLQAILCIRTWHRKSSVSRRYTLTVACLKERRFIITYYIWCDQYRKHRYRRLMMNNELQLASLTIQCAFRSFLAYRCVFLLKCKRAIALLGKRYLARKLMYNLRRMQRMLADKAEGVMCIRQKWLVRDKLLIWKKQSSLIFGVLKLWKAYVNDKLRRRFVKWNKYRIHRNRILNKRITIVQSVVRMWLVHHRVLKYYKWRRGLLAIQAIYRMKRCYRQYEHTIFYFRAAKKIQKIIRGYVYRSHLVDARIADIHYAAANNNYDRLKYYIEKHKQLVVELDVNGNNALHNAAKNAARRTMKLLVKSNILDPNVPNQAGYTALHLVIASPSANRDECFFYMLERGFDDEIRGPEGKTTLLIAAEFGRATIVRHLLVEEDYNPNIPDRNGTTCLQTACWQGNSAMVYKNIYSNIMIILIYSVYKCR